MSGAAREDEEDGAGAAHVVVITHPPEATGWEGPVRNGFPDGWVRRRAGGRTDGRTPKRCPPTHGSAVGQAIGAYTTPSLSISSPERPVKPTICQPDGAVNVAVLVVAVPEVRVRALSVVNAAEKILVLPSF